ncbi:hypothetical protein F7725_007615, partial [Dissostichus mawsoni]
MYAGAPRELQRLSGTRWACRHIACRTVLDRLPAIIRVLEEIAAEHSGDRSVDARGLLLKLTCMTCTKVFGDARYLSDLLHSPTLDLCSAVDLVEALVKRFQDYRDETYFEGLWKEVLNTSEKCNVETEPIPKRKTKQSRMLDGHTVMSSVGAETKDTFRASIFYPVLDNMLGELNRRFSKPNCEIMMGIQALNPSSVTFCEEQALFAFASIYECNIDDLGYEVHQMKRILERKVTSGMQKPSSIVELTKSLNPLK